MYKNCPPRLQPLFYKCIRLWKMLDYILIIAVININNQVSKEALKQRVLKLEPQRSDDVGDVGFLKGFFLLQREHATTRDLLASGTDCRSPLTVQLHHASRGDGFLEDVPPNPDVLIWYLVHGSDAV